MERLAYTPKDFAESTGIHISNVYRLINSEQLKARKVGRKFYISADSAKEFLNGTSHVRTNA